MNLRDFDFNLPEGSIAYQPAPERDSSRLFVLDKAGGSAEHRILKEHQLPKEHRLFRDIAEYLREGDILLLNKTKVIPARLTVIKPTGGKLEILLVRELSPGVWEVLLKKKYAGEIVIGSVPDSNKKAELKDGRLYFDGPREELLRAGLMPLPPYIKRAPEEADRTRYQTVYAEDEGSIAAPTAGLHFTKPLLDSIKEKGVLVRHLTLHVGKGTFMPVRADRVSEHKMEAEYFEVPLALLREIEKVKANGGRLITVGTTATRAIEAVTSGRYCPLEGSDGVIKGSTDIFIHPGHEFRAVDGLITNFHLPRSTPLMLASAFAGRERILAAYEEAVAMNYRFFSYGDAMLIK